MMTRTTMMAAVLAAAALAAAATGCGSEGDLRLSTTSAAGTGGAAGTASTAGTGGKAGGAGSAGPAGTGGSSGSSGQAGAAGAPIRTVTQRNPYGHVEQTDNLLWDGDFEWTGPFVQQYAWSSGKSWSVAPLTTVRLDPACRSGLKCAFVKKSAAIGGVAVSPSTATTRVHGWVKVAAGETCSKVSVYLTGCFASGTTSAIKTVSDAPDATSWCEFDEEHPTLDQTPCLFVLNKTAAEVVVDDMYLGPGVASPPPSSPSSPLAAPPAADAAAIEDVRDSIREHRRDPGPSLRQKPLARPPRVR